MKLLRRLERIIEKNYAVRHVKYAHMGLCNLCNVSISPKTKNKKTTKKKNKNHQSEKMITIAIHTGNVQMLRAKELQVKTNVQSSDWLHVHRS